MNFRLKNRNANSKGYCQTTQAFLSKYVKMSCSVHEGNQRFNRYFILIVIIKKKKSLLINERSLRIVLKSYKNV